MKHKDSDVASDMMSSSKGNAGFEQCYSKPERRVTGDDGEDVGTQGSCCAESLRKKRIALEEVLDCGSRCEPRETKGTMSLIESSQRRFLESSWDRDMTAVSGGTFGYERWPQVSPGQSQCPPGIAS
jgi:hypothetical protein